MNSNDLIKKLTNDAQPISKLSSPLVRCLKWLALSLFVVSISWSLTSIRKDLSHQMEGARFFLESSVLLLLAISSALSVFIISIPRTDMSRISRFFPILPMSLWALLVGGALLTNSENQWSAGMPCATEILILSLSCFGLIVWMIRKAAPTNLLATSCLAFMASTAIAAFALNFSCSNSEPLHSFAWHFTPAMLIITAGSLLGRRLFKW
ncbi:MAG: hypothetical protein COV44_02765 [Deltaproteobacteria bacterium CG11_big_fil_rev_8_21_14_0_20_45_16]|nr:MAG: hypothetical protein COV44_02765 [Deltaproteobacteria bacterium CG11_big_fil_rev_8_21_14_0_20_45_16]